MLQGMSGQSPNKLRCHQQQIVPPFPANLAGGHDISRTMITDANYQYPSRSGQLACMREKTWLRKEAHPMIDTLPCGLTWGSGGRVTCVMHKETSSPSRPQTHLSGRQTSEILTQSSQHPIVPHKSIAHHGEGYRISYLQQDRP